MRPTAAVRGNLNGLGGALPEPHGRRVRLLVGNEEQAEAICRRQWTEKGSDGPMEGHIKVVDVHGNKSMAERDGFPK